MHVAFVTKSSVGSSFSLYDSNLSVMESESFSDLFTLNFHLQALVKKHKIKKGLLVVHDKDTNKVGISIAEDDNYFIS
jgi:hypothetical protein